VQLLLLPYYGFEPTTSSMQGKFFSAPSPSTHLVKQMEVEGKREGQLFTYID